MKSTTGTLSSKENLDVSSLGFPAGLEVISIIIFCSLSSTDCTSGREEGRQEYVRYMTRHVCLRLKPCLLSMQMVLEMLRTKNWKGKIFWKWCKQD